MMLCLSGNRFLGSARVRTVVNATSLVISVWTGGLRDFDHVESYVAKKLSACFCASCAKLTMPTNVLQRSRQDHDCLQRVGRGIFEVSCLITASRFLEIFHGQLNSFTQRLSVKEGMAFPPFSPTFEGSPCHTRRIDLEIFPSRTSRTSSAEMVAVGCSSTAPWG